MIFRFLIASILSLLIAEPVFASSSTTALGIAVTALNKANNSAPNIQLYVSNAASNGFPVGNDANNCTASSPCLTITRALSLAPVNSTININGTFSLNSSLIISLPVTVQGVTSDATISTNSNLPDLISFNISTGSVNLSNIKLQTTGTTTPALYLGTSGVSINLKNITANLGTSSFFTATASNGSLNLNADTISLSGNGFGFFISSLSSGKINVTNLTTNLAPTYQGNIFGSTFYVDANGSGATSSSTSFSLTNFNITSTWPTETTAITVKDILIENVGLVTIGGPYPNGVGSSSIITENASDVNVSCRPVSVDTDLVNPVMTASAVEQGYTSVVNCPNGDGGARMGFEGWPQMGLNGTSTITASQSGTTMTVSAIVGPTFRLVPGVTIVGGPNWTGTTETIVSQISGTPGGAGTYQMSVSQSLSSGTLIPGVPNFLLSAKVQGVKSIVGPNGNSGSIGIEGGPFCGYESGCLIQGNYVNGANFGAVSKGATNDVWLDNVFIASGAAPQENLLIKGSTGTVVKHNTFLNLYVATTGFFTKLEQASDIPQANYPYATNITFDGNIFANYPSSTAYRFLSYYNSCSSSCLTTAGGRNTATFTNNFYYLAGTISTGYPFAVDGTVGTSYVNYYVTTLANWVSSTVTNTSGYDPNAPTGDPILGNLFTTAPAASQVPPIIVPSQIASSSLGANNPGAGTIDYVSALWPSTGYASYGAVQVESPVNNAQLTSAFSSVTVKTAFLSTNNTIGSSAGTNYFMPLSGALASAVTAETNLIQIAPYNMTLRNLYAYVNLAPTGGSVTFTVRQGTGGAAPSSTLLTCTIPASSTTCSDTVHTVTVNTSDRLTIMVTPNTGTTAFGKPGVGVEGDQR